ncbi:MAG: hypothetical protein ACUVQY_01425 [Thermoproteota archaeon]
MSILLLKMILKELLRNPYSWGWGFFFMSFWLLMGAYVFSINLPTNLPGEAYFHYTGSWFSMGLAFSFSALAVGIVHSAFYSSFSLRYLTKYSTLDSKRYYLVNLLSIIIYFSIFLVLLGLETVLIYSIRFNVLLLPKHPLELALASILSTIFIYVFSCFIVYLVVVLRKPKMVSFGSFLPLVISYPLPFLQLYTDIGYTVVISPFNATKSLLYHYYAGLGVPKGALVTSFSGVSEAMDHLYFWASLVSWTILFSIINIVLIGRQKGVSIEELRQL